ncbi:hypothetical protein [Planomicrobium okeanokoites]|uniref:hypothetical protein n=1 Tax=Planomicrobium okeanokoites TaxID=244 RepID=UPI0009FCC27B|nr:hypothetical protein [Planomicrobium okeanokoites]
MNKIENIHQALLKASEDCIIESPQMEQQEMYILYCLYHELSIDRIDFSQFDYRAVDSAKDRFEECIRTSDEEGNIRFLRQSAWGTVDAMCIIMTGFRSLAGKRVIPSFPLI